jgi:hypothetical protein
VAAADLDPGLAGSQPGAQTGVSVSVTTVSLLLRHLGARWGMARPTGACPWERRRKRARLQAIAKATGPYRPGEAV